MSRVSVAKFPEQFIQQVAQATDIVELVGQYVALTRRGKEYVGLCPFHDDKTPSMYVTPVKQIFKCFACGAGGGVYQFLMLYEKLTFPEAVRTLAERANIPLPRQAGGGPVAEEGGFSRNDLMGVATFAARFFRSQLRGAGGQAALEYARSRGLSEESIDRFGLGFAPDSWDALLRGAAREGISENRLVAAGLVARRESGGCYDRFRNRLMFPIIDPQGRVIAFGGRALAAEERAKYLNSPESALFDKSAQLYALNWAREAIVASGQAVIVEGYLDALMPMQAGVGNVVATLGTALTDRHVRLLSRYARQIVLVFDADTAGQAAAERALEMFLIQRLQVRVATIPAGKDPCDYTLAEGAEALRRLIDEAPDALQYAWQRRRSELAAAGDNLADRRAVMEGFLQLVVSSAAYGAIDAVRRGQLAQHIAHLLNISAGELQSEMQRLARRITRSSGVSEPAGPAGPRGATALTERHMLEVLLNRPDLFDHAAERLDKRDFTDEEYRGIAGRVWSAGMEGRLSIEELLAAEESAAVARLLTDLASAGARRGNYEQTLDGAIERMLYERERRDLEALRSRSPDDEALRELSQRLKTPDVRRHPRIR